jgi:hypothetical protein
MGIIVICVISVIGWQWRSSAQFRVRSLRLILLFAAAPYAVYL